MRVSQISLMAVLDYITCIFGGTSRINGQILKTMQTIQDVQIKDQVSQVSVKTMVSGLQMPPK